MKERTGCTSARECACASYEAAPHSARRPPVSGVSTTPQKLRGTHQFSAVALHAETVTSQQRQVVVLGEVYAGGTRSLFESFVEHFYERLRWFQQVIAMTTNSCLLLLVAEEWR